MSYVFTITKILIIDLDRMSNANRIDPILGKKSAIVLKHSRTFAAEKF